MLNMSAISHFFLIDAQPRSKDRAFRAESGNFSYYRNVYRSYTHRV